MKPRKKIKETIKPKCYQCGKEIQGQPYMSTHTKRAFCDHANCYRKGYLNQDI